MDELRVQHEKNIEHTIVETRKENTKVMLEARQKYTEEAVHRAKLYNRVMELQGNIRVLCRVRPILPHELAKGSDLAKDCTEFPVENDIIINDDDDMSHRFQFDSTFGPESTQIQVCGRSFVRLLDAVSVSATVLVFLLYWFLQLYSKCVII